jgi:hypothetical protein
LLLNGLLKIIQQLTNMDLQKKKEELEAAIKQQEANLLRMQGALIIVNEMLEEEDKEVTKEDAE